MEFDSITIAKEIVQTIIKSKKNLRMYPENNPIYIKTVDTAYNTFRQVLDYKDEMTLKIKQHDILYDGEEVYHNPNKEDSLALFFFKDGVRELTFKSGLEKIELEDFLKIIMLDFDKEVVDDDVVTMMWERDFQNISYIVDDTFLLDDEEYEAIAIEQAKENAADEDDVLRAYEDAFSGEDARHLPLVPLNDDDIAKLKEELDKDIGYHISKLVDLLFEMFFLSEKKDDYQDIVSFFRSAIDYALQYNYLELAAIVLRRTNELLNSERCPDINKPYFRMILSYINSERVITLLGEILDSKAEIDEEASNELFFLMDKSAIPGLIKILGDLDTIHARKIIINSLIILGKKDIALVAKGLNDNRWFVVRNIIYVLRNIGNKKAIEFLVKKLRHNDIRVRKEVIKSLGDLGGTEIVRYLKGFVDNSDQSVRILSVKAIAQTGSQPARKIIMEKVSSSDFKNKDLAEKKEFFEALSRWHDKEVITFLIKTLKKSPLFRRTKMNEVRACSAYALGLIGNSGTLETLKKFTEIKHFLIREYVNSAIKRIEHGEARRRVEKGA